MYGMRTGVQRLLILIFFTVVTVLLHSENIIIEAENFVELENLKGDEIQAAPGSACSGEQILVGLDYSGEWVDYELKIPSRGNYEIVAACRGDVFRDQILLVFFTTEDGDDFRSGEITFVGKGYR